MDRYADFNISKRQAMSVAFAIIADIEAFCDAHAEEYERFLLDEKNKLEGGQTEP